MRNESQIFFFLLNPWGKQTLRDHLSEVMKLTHIRHRDNTGLLRCSPESFSLNQSMPTRSYDATSKIKAHASQTMGETRRASNGQPTRCPPHSTLMDKLPYQPLSLPNWSGAVPADPEEQIWFFASLQNYSNQLVTVAYRDWGCFTLLTLQNLPPTAAGGLFYSGVPLLCSPAWPCIPTTSPPYTHVPYKVEQMTMVRFNLVHGFPKEFL